MSIFRWLFKYWTWLQADLRVTIHSHEHERLEYARYTASISVVLPFSSDNMLGLNFYLFVLQVSKTDGPWNTTPQLVAEDLK